MVQITTRADSMSAQCSTLVTATSKYEALPPGLPACTPAALNFDNREETFYNAAMEFMQYWAPRVNGCPGTHSNSCHDHGCSHSMYTLNELPPKAFCDIPDELQPNPDVQVCQQLLSAMATIATTTTTTTKSTSNCYNYSNKNNNSNNIQQ